MGFRGEKGEDADEEVILEETLRLFQEVNASISLLFQQTKMTHGMRTHTKKHVLKMNRDVFVVILTEMMKHVHDSTVLYTPATVHPIAASTEKTTAGQILSFFMKQEPIHLFYNYRSYLTCSSPPPSNRPTFFASTARAPHRQDRGNNQQTDHR